jgi:hypothetical protein
MNPILANQLTASISPATFSLATSVSPLAPASPVVLSPRTVTPVEVTVLATDGAWAAVPVPNNYSHEVAVAFSKSPAKRAVVTSPEKALGAFRLDAFRQAAFALVPEVGQIEPAEEVVDQEAANLAAEVAAIEAAEAAIALRVAAEAEEDAESGQIEAQEEQVARPPTPPWFPEEKMPALVAAPDDDETDVLGAETLDIADGFRISYNFSPKTNEPIDRRMSLDGANLSKPKPGR